MTAESIPAPAIDKLSDIISIAEDALEVCRTALDGIAQMDDSDQQAMVAIKVLAYIADRQQDIRNAGRCGKKLLRS